MQVTINGKRWRMVFDRVARDCDGHCEPPTQTKKRIVLRKSLRKRHQRLLEATIHELLHAAGWPLDEEFVTQFAEDAARTLLKQGWRLPDGPQNMDT